MSDAGKTHYRPALFGPPGGDFPCCMVDGKAADPEAAQLAAAMRTAPDGGEAAAVDLYRRAYLGHGDQLGALEAEAYAHATRPAGGAGRMLRRLLGRAGP